jgi:hypothetical protein
MVWSLDRAPQLAEITPFRLTRPFDLAYTRFTASLVSFVVLGVVASPPTTIGTHSSSLARRHDGRDHRVGYDVSRSINQVFVLGGDCLVGRSARRTVNLCFAAAGPDPRAVKLHRRFECRAKRTIAGARSGMRCARHRGARNSFG